MMRGIVLIYFSCLGGWLRPHQELMLAADAQTIAKLKRCDFGGIYQSERSYPGNLFFVPDDCLLADEAQSLGIRGSGDLYGGVVPHPFVKTKSITHPLVADDAARPAGWSRSFGEQVRDVVLRGYTAFSVRDARVAATRLLARGSLRVKPPLGSGGRGQTRIDTLHELDPWLDQLSPNDIATYGLVLEENLDRVTTRSVGHVTVDDLTMAYHGKQRRTTDNNGRSVYGGSDLICVRGSWAELGELAAAREVRDAVDKAKVYDDARRAYPGLFASRRNYDIGEGLDATGRWRSGVLEASWRVGGATGAEVLALTAFMQDPSLHIVEVSHVEKSPRYVPLMATHADASPTMRHVPSSRQQAPPVR